MLGYWQPTGEESEVLRGEWFIGGDAGTMDEDGYIAHLGRHNDLMNAGGFRVSPAEVEQELAKHPAIAEVAVTEVAVRDGVSIVVAFVVAHGSARTDLQIASPLSRPRCSRPINARKSMSSLKPSKNAERQDGERGDLPKSAMRAGPLPATQSNSV